MQNDFKENYIEEQKKLAAERRARLAKIGMGNDAVSHPASVQSGSARASRPEQNARPAQPARPTSPAPQQRPAPATSRPVQAQQRPAAPQQRPVQPAQQTRPAAPQQSPVQSTSPAPQQRPQQSAEKPISARPAQSQSSVASNADNTNSAPVRSPSANAGTNPTPQQRPQQRSAQRPANGASYGGYNQRRKSAPTETDIFKKELSDNESRAMMFALTGKPEQPDDGGDVDIINMGRIKAPKRKKEEDIKKKSNAGRYVGRSFAAFGLALAIVVVFVFSSIAIIAHGPSTTIRDLLVLTAEHSSAAKWVPYLFLEKSTVEGIINKSEETVKDIVSVDDYVGESENEITEDEWANAQDGMIFKTVSGPTFKAYVLLVKDPSRIFVGTAQESLGGKPYGDDVFHITKFYNAVAAINGGEFPDNGGGGTGHTPIGLTYSKGKCVHDDGHKDRTFLGITNDNKLVVNEGMTKAKADELGIRDAVSFQKGNTLIQNNGTDLTFHYQDGNTGVAQRTGIGQRADGTMILVVTDGRTASSLGATHNDMIDLMVSFGAVTAGLLDGGSSSLMYYKDYYNKYDYDYEKLDEYQKLGLVNNYKAFTEPRKIPTFFIVSEE